MAHEFEQAGIAAYLPGMRLMIERMQAAYDELLERLQALQEGTAPRIGRPPGAKKTVAANGAPISKYDSWSRLPPAEYERRRAELSALKKSQLKQIAAKAKSPWAGMSPEERSREMKRRMALWDKGSRAKANANLRHEKRVNAATKAAQARWGKPNGQAALSPQARGWANMTPEARAKRAASSRKSQKLAVAALRGRKGSSSGGAVYWAKMTPEERSAEVSRRQAVAKAKREAQA